MITAIMQAMASQAKTKARALNDQGKLETYIRGLVENAEAEIEAQNVPKDDPNRERMVREIAMASALEQALSDPEPETM